MAGNGYYFVGPNQEYKEVQQAIQALYDDQGTQDFQTEQRIIIAENGVYEPFRLDPDILKPTSSARLTIGSALGIQAVVSGRKNPSKAAVGCLVGNNIPYVTVERIFFRDLRKGVVFGVNCHRGIVNQSTFLQCGNVGVWVYQADECLIANSIFVNNDHAIAVNKPRSVAVIHNTLFNDAGFSTARMTWLMYLDLQDDRGQGVEDTGQFTFINNILMCQGGGGGLLMYEKDMPWLDSNYNDWWFPGDGTLVEVREGRHDGTVSQERLQKLELWRTRSGQDYNSLTDEPGFIKPAANESGASIDLKLLKTSGLIKKGKLLCGDPTNDLPTYFEDSILCTDFNGKSRTSQPTIGANEVVSTNSFYGHSIFSDSEQVEDDELICGDDWAAFDRAAGQYASAVPQWHPKVHSGYFYWRDHEYYLYAKKAGYDIADFRRTTFALSAQLVPQNIQVFVSGVDVTATATWSIEGLTFVLHHAGLNIEKMSSQVELYGDIQEWNTDLEAFVYKRVKHRWHINEGSQTYVFPSNPIEGAPIVVTDGLVQLSDQTGLAQEFSTEYDREIGVTYLRFADPNMWLNPEFYYRTTGEYDLSGLFATRTYGYIPEEYEYANPTGWIYAVGTGELSDGTDFVPLRGGYSLSMSAADTGNFIGQRFNIDPEEPYVFSAYGCVFGENATGDIGVSLEFYDHEQRTISVAGDYRFYLTATTGDFIEWTRFGLNMWPGPDGTYGAPDLSDLILTAVTGVAIPIMAESVMVRVHPSTGDLVMGVDCLQLERGYLPTSYTRIPRNGDLTVEYETSDDGFYTVEDLTLHSVRNANANGFLAITPIPSAQWDPDAPEGSTTLTDDWAAGRTGVLPWAKTSGHQKYRRVINFGLERKEPDEVISPDPTVAYPGAIRVTPSLLFARQGTDAEDFGVEVVDQHGNPFAFEKVFVYVSDPTGEFPGYIARKEWGFYTQLGQTVSYRLNEAGAQTFQWIPPEQEDIEYRGDRPTAPTGDSAAFLPTNYRVYPPNHGDPVIRDQFSSAIPTTGSQVTGEHYGYAGANNTFVDLEKYPIPGSLQLHSHTTGDFDIRFEEVFYPPVGDRQYLIDYENKQVLLSAGWDQPVRVTYTPRLAWRDPRYDRRLYFAQELVTQLTGDISIQYDALLDILIEVPAPTGQPLDGTIWLKVPAVAQHTDR